MNIWKHFDLFSSKLHLTQNGKAGMSTFPGFLLSLVVVGAVAYANYQNLTDFFLTTNPEVNQTTKSTKYFQLSHYHPEHNYVFKLQLFNMKLGIPISNEDILDYITPIY